MKNIFIIGGCHVTNNIFRQELKENFGFKSVREIHTHINDDNFKKTLDFLIKERILLSNYKIVIQIGNFLFCNSIMNLLPKKIRNYILLKISTNQLLDSHPKKNQELNSKINSNNFYKISYTFIRTLVKILIYPINLIFVPIKGFFVFQKIKNILMRLYETNEIIIFTPLKSMNKSDNLFQYIGKKSIVWIFRNMKNVRIFDFYKIEFNENNFKDSHHLSDEGIKKMTKSFIYQFNHN